MRAFVAKKYGSRAAYFSHAKKLRSSGEAPQIKLQNTAPPAAGGEQDMLDLLRERFGRLGNG